MSTATTRRESASEAERGGEFHRRFHADEDVLAGRVHVVKRPFLHLIGAVAQAREVSGVSTAFQPGSGKEQALIPAGEQAGQPFEGRVAFCVGQLVVERADLEPADAVDLPAAPDQRDGEGHKRLPCAVEPLGIGIDEAARQIGFGPAEQPGVEGHAGRRKFQFPFVVEAQPVVITDVGHAAQQEHVGVDRVGDVNVGKFEVKPAARVGRRGQRGVDCGVEDEEGPAATRLFQRVEQVGVHIPFQQADQPRVVGNVVKGRRFPGQRRFHLPGEDAGKPDALGGHIAVMGDDLFFIGGEVGAERLRVLLCGRKHAGHGQEKQGAAEKHHDEQEQVQLKAVPRIMPSRRRKPSTRETAFTDAILFSLLDAFAHGGERPCRRSGKDRPFAFAAGTALGEYGPQGGGKGLFPCCHTRRTAAE